jgi:hypothetical protein
MIDCKQNCISDCTQNGLLDCTCCESNCTPRRLKRFAQTQVDGFMSRHGVVVTGFDQPEIRCITHLYYFILEMGCCDGQMNDNREPKANISNRCWSQMQHCKPTSKPKATVCAKHVFACNRVAHKPRVKRLERNTVSVVMGESKSARSRACAPSWDQVVHGYDPVTTIISGRRSIVGSSRA